MTGTGDPGGGCADDDTLLAFARGALGGASLEALEAHVARCSNCGAILAAAFAGAGERGSRFHGVTLNPGELVGARYRVVRLLGRGGMGEVYEVEDCHLGRRVALKTVAITLSDDAKALARLEREVQLASRIRHPNVCRIDGLLTFDCGSFVSMELLAGESLRDRFDRVGRMEVADVAELLPQILAGLGAAHAAGIVHRDLKPDNVMICPAAGERLERVVLTDFGLARTLAVGPGLPQLTTNRHHLLGSPAYLAPEQIMPGARIGATADIYALGVMLFELLTGTLPFEGRTPLETALLRLNEPARSVREPVPGIDPAWARLVARCLERHPEHRFQTVADVSVTRAAEPGWRPPAGSRRRWWIAAVAGLAATVAATWAALFAR